MFAELNLLLALGALFALWQWVNRGHENADRASENVCRDLQVQRLDGAVTLRRIRLCRHRNSYAVERTYRFEYSVAGTERQRGEIALFNARPAWARLNDADGSVHVDLTR